MRASPLVDYAAGHGMTAIRDPHSSGQNEHQAHLGVWPMAKALAHMVDDSRKGLRERLDRIQPESGSIHCTLKLDESVDYAGGAFNEYRTYGGLNYLGGAAAEVGPGDNAGLALLLQLASVRISATWKVQPRPGVSGIRQVRRDSQSGPCPAWPAAWRARRARGRAQLGRPERY